MILPTKLRKPERKTLDKTKKMVAEGESLKIVSDFFFFVQKLTSIRIDLLLEDINVRYASIDQKPRTNHCAPCLVSGPDIVFYYAIAIHIADTDFIYRMVLTFLKRSIQT